MFFWLNEVKIGNVSTYIAENKLTVSIPCIMLILAELWTYGFSKK